MNARPRGVLLRVPPELRRVVTALGRRWPLVLISALGVVLVAVLTAGGGAVTHTAQLVVELRAPGPVSEPLEGAVLRRELRRAGSAEVMDEAVEALDDLEDPIDADALDAAVSVRAPSQDGLLAFTAGDASPDRAARLVEAVVDAYLDARAAGLRGDVRERADGLTAQIEALRADVDDTTEDDPVRTAVADEVVELLGDRAELRAALEEDPLDAGEALGEPVVRRSGGGSPLVGRGLVALLAGVVLGVALALLRDWLDPTVRDEAELVERAGGLPVLARLGAGGGDGDADGAARLRTAVTTDAGASPVVVLVLGAGHTDDDAAVAAALADAAVRRGDRVVVVDADLSRGRLTERLGLDGRGLTEAAAGEASLSEVVVEHGGMRVVPAGAGSGHPCDLLARARTGELLAQAAETCDIVVVAGGPGTDPGAVELARHASRVVLVATVQGTRLEDLEEALELLGRTAPGVAGLVVGTGGS